MKSFRSIRETARTGILPENALRRMVREGRVPGLYSGNRFLVNVPALCRALDIDPDSLDWKEADTDG